MEEFLTTLVSTILDLVFNIGTGLADRLKFLSTPDTTELKGIKSGEAGEVLLTTVNVVWQYLIIIGIGMTLIYFLIEINQKLALEGRDLTLKSIFAPILKLFVAIVILSAGAEIMSWILSLNDTMVGEIASKVEQGNMDVVTDTILENWKNCLGETGFVLKLLVFLPLILTFIIAQVCQLIWWYKTITYKLEFLFRISITPVAFADVYSGQNSNVFKWLKGFLALELYAVGICIVPSIAGQLLAFDAFQTEDIFDFIPYLASCLLLPIASLGIMGTIKQATKEALG